MEHKANLNVDEDSFIGTLIALTRQKHFRTAWNYLSSNVSPSHVRIHDAGVVLEDLANYYGDIGSIQHDCILKKELENRVEQVVKLLI